MTALASLRDWVSENLEQAYQRQSAHYNLRRREVRVGDLVLKRQHVLSFAAQFTAKLVPKFQTEAWHLLERAAAPESTSGAISPSRGWGRGLWPRHGAIRHGGSPPGTRLSSPGPARAEPTPAIRRRGRNSGLWKKQPTSVQEPLLYPNSSITSGEVSHRLGPQGR